MRKFNYDISTLEVDFYGDAKIDVFDEDELVFEIRKIDNSMWLIEATFISNEMVLITREEEYQFTKYITKEIEDKLGFVLPVVLHPNFFLSIDNMGAN